MKIYVSYPHSNAKNLLEKYFKLNNPATYKDKECIKVQCTSLKSRGINDLIDLVQTHYPKVSDKRICKILIELYNKETIESIYCPQVGGPVFFTRKMMNERYGMPNIYNTNYFRIPSMSPYRDSKHYNIKYSFNEILNLANE